METTTPCFTGHPIETWAIYLGPKSNAGRGMKTVGATSQACRGSPGSRHNPCMVFQVPQSTWWKNVSTGSKLGTSYTQYDVHSKFFSPLMQPMRSGLVTET